VKERSRVFAAKALLFLGLLVLAWAIYLLVSLLTLPAWAQAFLVMVATKVLTDLAFFRLFAGIICFYDRGRGECSGYHCGGILFGRCSLGATACSGADSCLALTSVYFPPGISKL